LILYSKILHRTSKFLSHRIIKLNAIRLMLVARTGEYSYVQRSWCWCWVWAVRHQVGKIGIVGNCGLEIYGALLRTSLARGNSQLTDQQGSSGFKTGARFAKFGCDLAAPVVKPELPNGPRLSSGGSFLFRHVCARVCPFPSFASPFPSSSAVNHSHSYLHPQS
jgi:hypothetical protein